MGERVSPKASQEANCKYLDLSNILDNVGLLAESLILSYDLYVVSRSNKININGNAALFNYG
jgi:hypothetical protein